MEDWLREVAAYDGSVPAALATIVRTVGSTPREAGARMLVYADGRTAGTVGGGCGEAEIRKAALDVIDTGRPKLVGVDLRGFFGEEQEVCGGRIEVFVEPLRAQAARGHETFDR